MTAPLSLKQRVAGFDEIKFFITSWGSQAMVLEPESLREEIRAEAEAMQDKYSKADEELEKPVRA